MPIFRRQEPARERTEEEREAARHARDARRRGDVPRTPAAVLRAESAAADLPPADPSLPAAGAPPADAAAPLGPPEDRVPAVDDALPDGPPLHHAPHVDGSLPAEPPVSGAPEDPLARFAPPTEAWPHEDVAAARLRPPSGAHRLDDPAPPPPADDLLDAPTQAWVPADPPAPAAPVDEPHDPPAPTWTGIGEPAPASPAGEPLDASTQAWVPADPPGPPDERGDAGAGPPTEVWTPDEVEQPTEAWPAVPAEAAGAFSLADAGPPEGDPARPADPDPDVAAGRAPGPPTEVWAPEGAAHRAGELPPDGDEEPWSAWADEPLPEEPRRVPAPRPVVPPVHGRATRFDDEDERPVPLRRPGARRTLPPTPPAPGGGGRPPRGRRGFGGGGGGDDGPGGSGRGRRRRGALLVALLALVLLLGVAAFVAASVYQPFGTDDEGRVRVEVPQNATAAEIADLLERRGVIASSFFFDLRARLDGGRTGFRAGTYTLRRDMPYDAAIAALTAGPPPARTINVTIPEGRSRRETAPLVRQAGLRGDYLRASRRPTEGFSLRRFGAPRRNGLEGFLFPATYELRPRASARTLVARQLDAFEENFARVDLRRARARNLSRYDVLVIASMIEREATLARERRLMSAVIHNRLRQSIPLGIDATTRYETDNWTRPIRQSELEADTPYNTRINQGLPPGPIGNPGLASLRAAANPADSDVLYYVARICGEGAHDFSASDAEFQRDVARYNAERERRGGRAPTNC